MSQPIQRTVGTAALFGLVISVPGAIGFIVSSIGEHRLPSGNFGYVNLIAVALISSVTVWTAPIGAKLAHRLTIRQLSTLFASVLFNQLGINTLKISIEGIKHDTDTRVYD